MPALNFQARFAPLIISGAKRQTIRRVRKTPIKPGDRLCLYTGMRTKGCRKIGEAVCEDTASVWIYDDHINVGGRYFPPLDLFAKADGLSSWAEMRDFFREHYGLPFKGVIIYWRDFKGAKCDKK